MAMETGQCREDAADNNIKFSIASLCPPWRTAYLGLTELEQVECFATGKDGLTEMREKCRGTGWRGVAIGPIAVIYRILHEVLLPHACTHAHTHARTPRLPRAAGST